MQQKRSRYLPRFPGRCTKSDPATDLAALLVFLLLSCLLAIEPTRLDVTSFAGIRGTLLRSSLEKANFWETSPFYT